MDEFRKTIENETNDKREEIKQKLHKYYDGRIVRKDLTKSIYTVIDRITVILNTKEDRYESTFSNLGVKNIPIHPDYVKD